MIWSCIEAVLFGVFSFALVLFIGFVFRSLVHLIEAIEAML